MQSNGEESKNLLSSEPEFQKTDFVISIDNLLENDYHKA